METIRVFGNGINFEVISAGAGSRLALCLHGFPECAFSWRYQIPLLASLGYRVWAPNLRGYGNTASPLDVSQYALEVLIADVAALIHASEATEVLVLAHDWGGVLAWYLAMQKPALIQKLIICNIPHPACFLREVKRPRQFLRSWYVLFVQIPWLPEALLGLGDGYLIGKVFLRSTRDSSRFLPEVLDVYRANACRPGGLTAMLNWYRALFRNGAWRRLQRQSYPKIEIPTLFLWGDADAALSLLTTDETEKYVSDLEFHRLAGVSHWIQQESPEAVNTIIRSWLSKR